MTVSTLARTAQISRTPRDDRALDGALIGAGGRVYAPGTALDAIEPFTPATGAPGPRVYLINGVVTDAARQAGDLQAFANTTGHAVVGIHNATDAPGAKGLFLDLLQALADKIGLNHNPATLSAARVICDALRASDERVNVAAHSQGAVILSNALTLVKARLLEETGDPARARQMMARIHVETFGGASATFIDGPTYLHHVNDRDPVPVLGGVGHHKDHAANTTVDHFSTVNTDRAPLPKVGSGFIVASWAKLERSRHGLQEVYLARSSNNPNNALNAQLTARMR